MTTTGFAYVPAGIPAPPISFSPNTPPNCHALAISPSGKTYHCSRLTGHTGRCASYGIDRVIATWDNYRRQVATR